MKLLNSMTVALIALSVSGLAMAQNYTVDGEDTQSNGESVLTGGMLGINNKTIAVVSTGATIYQLRKETLYQNKLAGKLVSDAEIDALKKMIRPGKDKIVIRVLDSHSGSTALWGAVNTPQVKQTVTLNKATPEALEAALKSSQTGDRYIIKSVQRVSNTNVFKIDVWKKAKPLAVLTGGIALYTGVKAIKELSSGKNQRSQQRIDNSDRGTDGGKDDGTLTTTTVEIPNDSSTANQQ